MIAPTGTSSSLHTLLPQVRLGAEPLLADLYEFIMAQGYWLQRRGARASFSYFVRRAPFGGDYVVLTGVEPLLEALEGMCFSAEDLAYLEGLEFLRREFIDELRRFRFRGNVSCANEGEAVFPGVPVFRVEGTLLEAQLIAGLVLTHLNFQSVVATKAARVIEAASNRPVVELGVRRAHGLAGAAVASRAAYVGGVDMTSNVLAGRLFGIPVAGTMAHSWVMSADSEQGAFEAFASIYPERCTLLVDTYGVAEGLRNAIPILKRLARREDRQLGVRLDSGDPNDVVRSTRAALDAAGLEKVVIVLSGDLDEHRIDELVRARVPVDIWGVGSKLSTAGDEPALSGVYKLGAVNDGAGWSPRMKHSDSSEKSSLPGVNAVLRCRDRDGAVLEDVILPEVELAAALATLSEGHDVKRSALLRPRMIDGRRVEPAPTTSAVRDYATAARLGLPLGLRSLTGQTPPPVRRAASLVAMCRGLNEDRSARRATASTAGLEYTND
jgi:nicotinate phosphoribosyltransferase